MQAPLRARNDSDAAQTDTTRTVAQKWVLTDNRPEAVAQRKLAEMMNNSPRVLQQQALSDAIHNSPPMVAQRHEMNALFSGAVRPQGDGAIPAEASPAQREEKTNNTGLPNQLKSGIESLSGMSMDHVKVHYNSDKPAQLQAHAYAQGSEIHLGAGQERHLPHEAWHVVQQAQGWVRRTLQMKAGAVNDDPSLEKEADMMGQKAAQFEGNHGARNLVAKELVAGVVTQHVAGFSHAPNSRSSLTGMHQLSVLAASSRRVLATHGVAQAINASPRANRLSKLIGSTHPGRVIQCVSAFSQLLLTNTLAPLVTQHLPRLSGLFLGMLGDYMKIDDSADERWEVAEGFVQAFFVQTPLELYGPAIECMEALREALAAYEDRAAVAAVDAQLVDCIDNLLSTQAEIAEEEFATLAEARAYVESEKKGLGTRSKGEDRTYRNMLIASASRLVLAPSSGAHYLDGRESPLRPLNHVDQEHASKYHRSAKHPLYASFDNNKLANMVVKNKSGFKSGNGAEAHTGFYPNAFTFERNKASPVGAKSKDLCKTEDLSAPETTSSGDGVVFDQALEYKLSLCRKVEALCGDLTYLRVKVFNSYPLVMVRFDLEAFMAKYGKGEITHTDAMDKAFTSFLMNYYTGIANYFAQDAGLSISMVERSSFGFHNPSLAETGQSFRLNLGMMPPAYAYVHARALKKLDSQLAEIMKTKLAGKVAPDLATNDYFKVAKQEQLGAIDDLLALAVYPIESRSGSAIANAGRTRKGLDYVNAQSFNIMAKYQGKRNGLGLVLGGLFSYMGVTATGSLSTQVDASKTRYEHVVPATTRYPQDARLQAQYDEALDTLRSRLANLAEASKDEQFKAQLEALLPLLRSNQPHLEVTLDLINELILIHAIHQMNNLGVDLADGYGSGSDVEEADDDPEVLTDTAKGKTRKLIGKKVITHNGMRALLSSVDGASKVILPSEKALAMRVRAAYYEIEDGLKDSKARQKIVEDDQSAHILLTDLNACVTGEEVVEVASLLKDTQTRVWIIDTTSATQSQMHAVIEQFRVSRASTLFLVSSGFKQEQMGADRNQYGTIRTFTDKGEEGRTRLEQLSERTKKMDKPLAASAHIYRRIMKSLGAVPTNSSILTGAKQASTVSQGRLDYYWSQFDVGDAEDEETTKQRDALFDIFLGVLKQVPEQQDDDVGVSRADASRHASEFVHVQPAVAPKGVARREWFLRIPNAGGGDCLLHALNGRNLTFDEVVALRARLAESAGEPASVDLSGSDIYQTLYQSGHMTRSIHNLLQSRHRVPRSVFQTLIAVPGMYAGDAELQAYCAVEGNPAVVNVVTAAGELRRVTRDAIATHILEADQLKMSVQSLLDNQEVVLFKSDNHWEKITATQ